MMKRSLLAILLLSATMGVMAPAYAQDTDQTDQSEEDWRKSRKKSGTSDIYRSPNRTSTGLGLPIFDYEQPTAIDRLPSESRRHVMRERARAIAESPDGDLSDASYTPSEEAQNDEQLMRDEQAAWEEVTAPSTGTGSEGDQNGSAEQSGSGAGSASDQGQSDGTGQSEGMSPGVGPTPSQNQTPRGGSAASLQEIMDAIKGGQASASGSSGSAQSDGESGSGSASQSGEGQSGKGQSAGGQSGEGQSGEGQSGDGATGEGQSGGSDGSGSSGSQSASRTDPDLSPLEIIRRSKEERAAEGRQRSASDYLGHKPDEAPDE